MSKSCTESKVLLLSGLLVLSVGIVSAQGLTLNVISPPQNNSVTSNETIHINATVDPEGDSKGWSAYNLTYVDSSPPQPEKINKSFNTTLDAGTLEPGNYNLTFKAQDSAGDTGDKLINFSIAGGGGGPEGPGGGGEGLEIDDQKASTRDTESPNIAFLGNDLDLQNGDISHLYNLTRNISTSETLIDGHNVTDDPITTSLSDPEGRYTLYDENNSNNNISIDLVRNYSEVVGRVNSTNVTNVSMHYWQNGSYEPGLRQGFSLNTSWDNSTGESLFRMNITDSVSKFWLNITLDSGSKFTTSRGAQAFRKNVQVPRVNDVNIFGTANFTGNVTNNMTNAPEKNIRVRIRRKPGNEFYPSRFPKATVPPTKYQLTDSSGRYKFTGLQSGNYIVDVRNYSAARSSKRSALDSMGTPAKPNFPGNKDFNVTMDVGNASLKMIGNSGSNLRYGFIISNYNSGNSYLKTGVNPGVETRITVPNGSYSILAAKFVSSDGFFPSILTDSANVLVPEGSSSQTKELGFPKLVTINGTVEDSSNNPVKNVQVIAENQSEAAFFSGRTDSNGEYSLKVRNQTNYSLTVEPGFDSELSSKNKTISVPENKTVDFTLSTGPYIEGYYNISSDGTGVEDVRINAFNSSLNSYGFAETGPNGYFKIGGLRNNTDYTLFVETPPGYPSKQRQDVTALSSGNWTNFTSGSTQRYDLNGTIKSESGKRLNATVIIESLSTGKRSTNITSNGSYSFSQIDSGSYGVLIEPENSSFSSERTRLGLSSNETVNFSLSRLNTVSGYVTSKSGNTGLSDVLVVARNTTSGSFGSDRTNSSGYYSIEVSNVSHTVELYPAPDSSYQYNSSSINTSVIGGSRDFELESGVYLAGNVRDPGVKNLSGYISIWNNSVNITRYQKFDDGSYNVTGLDKSVGYNIYVNTDNSSYGFNRSSITDKSVPGTRDFNFTGLKGPEVWVTVKANSTGGTLANATVTLNGSVRTTNSQGIAKFGKQVDGKKVTIKATKTNYNTSLEQVTVKTNYSSGAGRSSREIQNETLVINNSIGNLVDVSINVTDGSGSYVSQATVVARSNATGRTSSGITDNSGSATLSNILPGKNYVTAISSGNKLEVLNVTFTRGDDTSTTRGNNFDLEYEVPK
ncbi:MAG: carboxypeptidase regulatory-like domain-containing protein [Candidatus Nanohaloarchaea archaeon]